MNACYLCSGKILGDRSAGCLTRSSVPRQPYSHNSASSHWSARTLPTEGAEASSTVSCMGVWLVGETALLAVVVPFGGCATRDVQGAQVRARKPHELSYCRSFQTRKPCGCITFPLMSRIGSALRTPATHAEIVRLKAKRSTGRH